MCQAISCRKQFPCNESNNHNSNCEICSDCSGKRKKAKIKEVESHEPGQFLDHPEDRYYQRLEDNEDENQSCDAQNSQNSKPLSYEEYKSTANVIVNYLRRKENEVTSKSNIIDWCLNGGLDYDNDSEVKIEIVTFTKHLLFNLFLFFSNAIFL